MENTNQNSKPNTLSDKDNVSERTWTVKEIIEQLQCFQNAHSAAAWFNMYGR
jgi:hypothetical protein